MRGRVDLVGAGPGHPGLLTVQAKACLEQADVVVYDRLVSPRLLTLAPRHAKLIYVGKQATQHTMAQRDIEAVLVARAARGQRVVRLKGGDPFVFGRGSEEALALRAAGIPFEVVPGITSAVSVPAYAGIPVTHRGVATSFTVVTGHERQSTSAASAENKPDTGDTFSRAIDALSDAKPGGTLVILMGLGQLETIVQQLIAQGFSSETPVGVVNSGTRSTQKTLVGRLSTIAPLVKGEKIASPAIIVVGDVVSLQPAVAWAETRPLFGRRILVTADTAHVASKMADALESLGAETYDFSTEHHTVPNVDAVRRIVTAVAQAPRNVNNAVWFQTALGVKLFFEVFRENGADMRALARVYFGAADASVVKELARNGICADERGFDVHGEPPQETFIEQVGQGGLGSARAERNARIRVQAWCHPSARHVPVTLFEARVRRSLLEAFERDCGLQTLDALWIASESSYEAFSRAASDTFVHRISNTRQLTVNDTVAWPLAAADWNELEAVTDFIHALNADEAVQPVAVGQRR